MKNEFWIKKAELKAKLLALDLLLDVTPPGNQLYFEYKREFEFAQLDMIDLMQSNKSLHEA